MQQAADLYLEKEKNLFIQTVKGRRFYIAAPHFDIEEIAHAASMQCRFTGHTREFYSVAEHSVLVSQLVAQVPECRIAPATPFEGLMHDAHEAYVSDIATPWKALLPDYRRMEGALEARMRAYYGLPKRHSPGVKCADWYALFIEARDLLPSGVTADWLTPTAEFRANLALVLPWFSARALSPRTARDAFLHRFAELSR